MKVRDMTNSGAANFKKYLSILVLIWTVGIIASLIDFNELIDR